MFNMSIPDGLLTIEFPTNTARLSFGLYSVVKVLNKEKKMYSLNFYC